MRLAKPPTYPGEMPGPSDMMYAIRQANASGYFQKEEEHNPFNLETHTAADFFGLDNEQLANLNHDGKRALTFLMWEIDDLTNDAQTLEAKIIEHSEWLSGFLAEKKITNPEEIERLSLTTEQIAEYDASDDKRFTRLASDYIDMASLVAGGNRPLIALLSAKYGEKVTDEARRTAEYEETAPTTNV